MYVSLWWLHALGTYVREKSFGLAAIRVLECDNITFGIIEPYGYYIVNFDSEIYLMRGANVAIKFFVRDDRVATAVAQLGYKFSIGYIDAVFQSPPSNSSKISKFILFHDDMPRHHTAISLINRCLDMRILYL